MVNVKELLEEKAKLLAQIRNINRELTGRILDGFGETIITVENGHLAIIQETTNRITSVVQFDLESVPKLLKILKKFAGEEK